MPRLNQDAILYQGGTITPHGDRWEAFVRLNGTRHRARVDSLARARAFIDGAISDPATPLTRAQIIDAQNALRLLPAGASLTEAARALAGSAERLGTTPLAEAVDQYLEERRQVLRGKTMTGYEHTLHALKREFPEAALSAIGLAEIHRYLGGLTAASRNARLRNLSAFWSWAVKHGLAVENITRKASWARLDEGEIRVFTPAQAKILLQKAEKHAPQIALYLAVGLFAGLRPAEMARLTRENIRDGFIVLDGKVAKVRKRRNIRIRPNLQAWLDAYPGPVCRQNERNRYRSIRNLIEKCEGLTWSHDVLRHTFGTMSYELEPDVPRICAEMGNQPGVFFDAYRALAKPGDGARFFRLCPTSVQQKS